MTIPPSSQQEVTRLLADWSGGDSSALERLIPLVEPELHRLAHHYMSREAIGHTLQTMALLNEAYLHLVDDPNAIGKIAPISSLRLRSSCDASWLIMRVNARAEAWRWRGQS